MKSVFIDTNVFVYSVDGGNPAKRERAIEVIAESAGRCAISVQVLQEFYSACTRKLNLPPSEARAIVEMLCRQRVFQPGPEMVLHAIDTSERYRISFWDALIVESAVAAGCDVLLTEDLTHGQSIRGVRIENPFRAAAP